jgi:ribosomal protein S18 acetylase RimI-like enzyme
MTTISAKLAFLTPAEVEEARAAFRDVYQQAFARPPYSRDAGVADGFAASLMRQINRQGFRALVAREPDTDMIVGFAYGYATGPGQWWHEQVARAMPREQIERWLLGAFELVEFAVAPRAQGQGLGSRLHDTLLQDLPYRTAMLSTMQSETVALQLYRRRGWVTLLRDFIFPGGARAYLIMGKDLEGK